MPYIQTCPKNKCNKIKEFRAWLACHLTHKVGRGKPSCYDWLWWHCWSNVLLPTCEPPTRLNFTAPSSSLGAKRCYFLAKTGSAVAWKLVGNRLSSLCHLILQEMRICRPGNYFSRHMTYFLILSANKSFSKFFFVISSALSNLPRLSIENAESFA